VNTLGAAIEAAAAAFASFSSRFAEEVITKGLTPTPERPLGRPIGLKQRREVVERLLQSVT
jgi:hypothetical protein